ncbi:unnamed protein product [Didymodactylos carnosus]|uniref:Uncharacterized protein n=1 Tax=Didymodactylos carnosus TaxID=1234261 RepID=A0A8S2F7I5_9BILA|nr:unnamed protein product [Didymodactylos carnosus]CAF4193235.1 unnamed protein product [Didymodactylos carnosus]
MRSPMGFPFFDKIYTFFQFQQFIKETVIPKLKVVQGTLWKDSESNTMARRNQSERSSETRMLILDKSSRNSV